MDDETITIPIEDNSRIGVGLLGVTISNEEWQVGGGAFLSARRLEEIERRILAIEARLA